MPTSTVHHRSALRRVVVVLGALAVIAAGCSSGDDEPADGDTTASTTSTTVAPPSVPPTAPVSAGTGGVTVTPNPVPIAEDGTAEVEVAWTGQAPRTLMFVSVCRKPTADPKFSVGGDCSPLSELNPNGTPDGNGTITLTVFRGPTPDGDQPWGCFAESDTPPPGVQKNTTCYVRVTNDVVLNNDSAREQPFTITPA